MVVDNSHVTPNKYLLWVGNVKQHYNILQTVLYTLNPLTICATKNLKSEELFLNKFFNITDKKNKHIYDILFITSPFIDILKIRTRVRNKRIFTIQVATQHYILRQVTLPFWINTYTT